MKFLSVMELEDASQWSQKLVTGLHSEPAHSSSRHHMVGTGCRASVNKISADRWQQLWLFLYLFSLYLNLQRYICGSKLTESWSLVGTAWRVLRLRMQKASRYGGELRIYQISSGIQSTMGGPPAWGLDEGLTTHRKMNTSRNVTQGLGLAGSCEHEKETYGTIKCWEFLPIWATTTNLYRMTLLHEVDKYCSCKEFDVLHPFCRKYIVKSSYSWEGMGDFSN
jgi:hypothetical protein